MPPRPVPCCSSLSWALPLNDLQIMPLQSYILGSILILVTWSPVAAFWPGVFPKNQRRCLPNATVSCYHVPRRAAPRRFCVGAITSTVTEMVRRDLPNTFSKDTRADFTEHAAWGAIEGAREGFTGTRDSLHTTVPRRRFMHLASLILATAATRLAVEPERVGAEETVNNTRSPGDGTQVVPGDSTEGAKYTVGSDEVGTKRCVSQQLVLLTHEIFREYLYLFSILCMFLQFAPTVRHPSARACLKKNQNAPRPSARTPEKH